MYSNAHAHMEELKKLYEQIHKNDAPPANQSEEQAGLVLESMKAMLMLMVQNHVDSKVLELCLFYHWFRMITLGMYAGTIEISGGKVKVLEMLDL